MRVLVTGGAGYIGAHAAKALRASGREPVVFDNLVCGHRDFVKWGPFIEGDLADAAALDAAFKATRPDAVMHFAAYASVGESVEDPSRYYRNNVVGSLNLLDAARRHGVRHFVFSSTCATYGVPAEIPISEAHAQRPVNPYGRTKLMIEEMLADYGAAYGLRSISLRYFNAAGADPDAEIGEDHAPETHLIPIALDAAMGRRQGVTVFGSDYATRDGTCVRDYVHVSDLASAHVMALDYLASGGDAAAMNLGCGRGYTVREVLEAVKSVTGRDFDVAEGERRQGDPPVLVSSADAARRLLKWEPRLSSIEVVIGHAWAWHRKRFKP